MSRMLTASECAAWLLESDDYLIISHRRPDGDTLGSGAALCSALRRAGKRAWCLDNPETINSHRPFVAPYLAGEGAKPVTPVTVDVASEGLFPEGVTGPIPLAIDHHPSNSRFAENLPYRYQLIYLFLHISFYTIVVHNGFFHSIHVISPPIVGRDNRHFDLDPVHVALYIKVHFFKTLIAFGKRLLIHRSRHRP